MDSTNSIAQFDHVPDPFEHPYEYYPLDVNTGHRLLPHEHEVVLNVRSGVALLIDWEERRVRAETEFHALEVPLLKKLLDDWPSYVEYAPLIHLLFANEPLATQFITCIDHARESQNSTLLNVALQPLRDVLSDCKGALHLLGLDITAVLWHGYRLISYEANNETVV